uniref:Uncharacterized protein n=1 Tax=Amphimedon queenslandica TaxID=400682 RepID=A0A1X7TTV6_AMPQE
MCKDEPEQMKQQIARKLNELPVNCRKKQKLLKIGNTLKCHRIFGAPEAVFCTTGLHLRGSSQSYVFINTKRPQKRGTLIKSNRELRAMSTEDDVFNPGSFVFNPGSLERYQSCPDGEPFDSMSVAHFPVWDNVTDKNYEPTTSGAQPRYQLKNGLGKIYLRKEACLRLPTITQEPHVASLADGNIDHQNLCGQNIGDVEDALTLDSISRRHFSDSDCEARIASLNDSKRVPYEKVLDYSRAVREFQMRTRESMPSPFNMFIKGGA